MTDVSKMSVQEKIADLEMRIVALEKGLKIHSQTTRYFTSFSGSSVLWEHWHKMWKEFDAVMKEAFK